MLDYLFTISLTSILQLGFLLFLGPAVYLIVAKLSYGSFGTFRHNIWHVMPVALSVLLAEIPAQLITFAAILQLVYVIASLRLVRAYHRAAFATQADAESSKLVWMYFPALLLGLLSFATLLFLTGLFPTTLTGFQAWLVIYFLGSVFCLFYISLRSVFSRGLFKGLKEYEAAQDAPTLSVDKEQRRNLKDEFKTLERLIEEKELFKQSDLSLHTISEQTGYEEREITLAISQEAGVNFCDYVNGLRVAAIKRRIDEGARSLDTVIDLALNMGFPNKGSFKRLFKRFAGTAPNRYIKEADRHHA